MGVTVLGTAILGLGACKKQVHFHEQAEAKTIEKTIQVPVASEKSCAAKSARQWEALELDDRTVIYRLAVPGGWLVSTVYPPHYYRFGSTLLFLDDKCYDWKIAE